MGWQGKILRVDLTRGTCEAEPLNMDWARQYLGQRGLATKYLSEEMDAKADSLSPENKLIFATGPLTGTTASTGGRYSVVTKGALTDAIACSNSGGHFGAELKMAGWDMIIFEGRAEEPVYLLLRDDQARLLPAGDFWGRSVWEVEPAIKARHQDPEIRVASIGRAGEEGVRYACVMNDLDRAAGRSGVGAVMGSKNLKAVAVRGTVGVTVNDAEGFLKAVAEIRGKLDAGPGRARLAKDGTLPMMDVTQAFGALPTRNSQAVQFEAVEKVNAAAVRRPRRSDGQPSLASNKACFACSIGCGRVATIEPGHFSIEGKEQYRKHLGGVEYESGYAFGPLVGVDDLDAMTYTNAACNEQGMDPISFGGTLAAAMELFEMGVITQKETGMPLKFGDAKAMVRMVELTGIGEGFGKDLGLGSKRLCEKYGHPELAMVSKGQEFPGYDGRGMQGMGLAYATSNRGACHLRASTYEADFASVELEGKAQVVKETQDVNSVTDSAGICAFPDYTLEDLSAQLAPACGESWSTDDLRLMGERIWNLEKQFNLDAGLTKDDDYLPPRILEEPAKTGAGKGRVSGLKEMLPEYYSLRGWDAAGVPTAKTRSRLGLA